MLASSIRFGPEIAAIDNSHSSNGYFDIGSVPESLRFNSFPQKIKLDWKVSENCFGNYVDIIR